MGGHKIEPYSAEMNAAPVGGARRRAKTARRTKSARRVKKQIKRRTMTKKTKRATKKQMKRRRN